MTYSIFDYGRMINDTHRMDAYIKALKRFITHESVVLDIGTGAGTLALLACQFGAKHVYAVEIDDAVQVARDAAKANDLQDRITLYQALSTEVTLPEQADIVISDLRGALPLYSKHIPSIIDARARHLAPGGTLIPQADKVYAACVEVPDIYASIVDPWKTTTFGLDMQSACKIVTNSFLKCHTEPEKHLSEPALFATLDYATITDPNVTGVLDFEIKRAGTMHGFAAWFDAHLADGILMSNASNQPKLIYQQLFFPLSSPVVVAEGDVCQITLTAKLTGDDYVWHWHTRIKSGSHEKKADFKQSSLLGQPFSLENIKKGAPTNKPQLTPEGQSLRITLELMTQNLTNQDIASELHSRLASTYPTLDHALSYVAKLAKKYSI